jgi:hypothetical protein
LEKRVTPGWHTSNGTACLREGHRGQPCDMINYSMKQECVATAHAITHEDPKMKKCVHIGCHETLHQNKCREGAKMLWAALHIEDPDSFFAWLVTGVKSWFHYHTPKRISNAYCESRTDVLGQKNSGQLLLLESRQPQSSGTWRASWWWSGFPKKQQQTVFLQIFVKNPAMAQRQIGTESVGAAWQCQAPYQL